MTFALHLARLVKERQPLVYMDEASFNMWMRNNRTWTRPDCSVKWVFPKFRGAGVTLFGAVSQYIHNPVFMKAKSTNRNDMLKFLPLVRRQFVDSDQWVYLVLDNHRCHHTKEVTDLARSLRFELMFLPPYCPELNSIEALWGILKRMVKKQLVANRQVTLSQEQFEAVLQRCVDSVTPEQ